MQEPIMTERDHDRLVRMTKDDLIVALHAAEQRAARLAEENQRLLAILDKADDMGNALTAYFNKHGIRSSLRKGNEDIADMADALSEYGPLRYDEMTARAALRAAMEGRA